MLNLQSKHRSRIRLPCFGRSAEMHLDKMKGLLLIIPTLLILGLWLRTGFGEAGIAIDQDSGDMGIHLEEGSAIFHINYYGDFSLGQIEPELYLDTYTGFSFRALAGSFSVGRSHPHFEPGFAISIPFWMIAMVASALPIFWFWQSRAEPDAAGQPATPP